VPRCAKHSNGTAAKKKKPRGARGFESAIGPSVRLASTPKGSLLDYFFTVIVEVPVLPAASLAVAVIVCEPAATFFVFHFEEIEPRFVVETTAPSTEIERLLTPTLSVALAAKVTMVPTVAPLAGLVIVTVGGVVSATDVTFSDNAGLVDPTFLLSPP
jgi:hypothetical protein